MDDKRWGGVGGDDLPLYEITGGTKHQADCERAKEALRLSVSVTDNLAAALRDTITLNNLLREKLEHKGAGAQTDAFEDLFSFEGRLAYVLRACGLTRAGFAKMLSGAGQQKITNWLQREQLGAPSRGEVMRITGASSDWINERVGEPFHDSPIWYGDQPDAALEALEVLKRLSREIAGQLSR